MTIQLSPEKTDLENEVHLSYFIKRKGGTPPRVAPARLLEISEGGLCMEISPLDSDLFMESGGQLYVVSRNLQLQIFCRSHPTNISVEGRVEWFRKRSDFHKEFYDGGICTGVVFSFMGAHHRKELSDFVLHLKNDRASCRKCNSAVSATAAFCYSCGSKLTRRRDLLKKALESLLNTTR